MKTHRPDTPDQPMDITPMIDVVFLLIVFFMVVAAEITNKIEIMMPEADRAVVPDDNSNRLEVTVVENGDAYVGMMPVTLDELSERIRVENEEVPGFRVYVRADANTPHEYIQTIMRTCAENGVFDIIFATLQDA
ncbi:biopolymer transporter ExbD [Ruficoccus amylovorans]|uniref:Biopolymer transporter ExbD n=1 Tax=Ruficoccus amylovorans TaxID=1804625 RepID=A0A842HJC7_9BACT|nr:biopolymer transporter ExbD [Ruficoccus amylovorans]MBC2596078.1 biopolymer transporter ExbD [Ruficoccus amylovorans]